MAKEELIKRERVYEGAFLSVRRDTVRVDMKTGPIESLLLEAPAGRLEQGEEPEDGARREMREETGHAAGRLFRMGGFWMAPGYSTEYMYAFLATNLRADPLPADEDEDIEVVPTPWKDILDLIRNGIIQDSKSTSALQMAYFLFQKEAGVGA